MTLKSFSQPEFTADLLGRATSLLNAEVIRLQPVRPVSPASALEPGEALSNPLGSSTAAPMDLLTSLLAGANVDELRRRASEFLELLLASLPQGKATPADQDRVPLLRGIAPVRAGATGSVRMRVVNEEASVSQVSLYASNFVADSGYELPSLLVSVGPRKASLPPGGEATFEIELAVPAQAPPGLYSGLVQATGCKYVKAVVMFEVL